MVATKKRKMTHKQIVKKAGFRTLELHGTAHFSEMGKQGWVNRRKREAALKRATKNVAK